jgi:hypothetical protein
MAGVALTVTETFDTTEAPRESVTTIPTAVTSGVVGVQFTLGPLPLQPTGSPE